jgi:hypothetical protein
MGCDIGGFLQIILHRFGVFLCGGAETLGDPGECWRLLGAGRWSM